MKKSLRLWVLFLAIVSACWADDATDTLREMADKGDAKAQWKLGMAYLEGKVVARDEVEAVKWWRKAADQGYAMALINLISMGADSPKGGVTQEEVAERKKALRKFAEHGDPKAQYLLGFITEDRVEAVKWFRKAADQGDEEAALALWGAYQDGGGVLKNPAEGIKWLRKAAELNSNLAQLTLAQNYEYGYGVIKDLVEAHAWYNIAGATGEFDFQHKDAVKARDRLEQDMTKEQIAEATKRARELMATIKK